MWLLAYWAITRFGRTSAPPIVTIPARTKKSTKTSMWTPVSAPLPATTMAAPRITENQRTGRTATIRATFRTSIRPPTVAADSYSAVPLGSASAAKRRNSSPQPTVSNLFSNSCLCGSIALPIRSPSPLTIWPHQSEYLSSMFQPGNCSSGLETPDPMSTSINCGSCRSIEVSSYKEARSSLRASKELLDGGQDLGVDRTEDVLPLSLALDEPRVAKLLEVVRNGRERQVEPLGDLGHAVA